MLTVIFMPNFYTLHIYVKYFTRYLLETNLFVKTDHHKAMCYMQP